MGHWVDKDQFGSGESCSLGCYTVMGTHCTLSCGLSPLHFGDRILLCSVAHSVSQAGFDLTIFLSQPPQELGLEAI